MKNENPARILFIEDDTSGRELGIYNLQKAGYHAEGAADGRIGLKMFDDGDYDVVVTDIKMPGITGLDVLREIRAKTETVPVLVITAFADVETAVSAMKAGAFDFIGKPFNRDHLLLTIEKALKTRRMRQELKNLRIKASGIEREVIYKSDAIERVLEITDRIAATDATVLITGESGTGKELIARRLHVQSDRAENEFVALNAAAMPGQLIESELFGHTKGAFTGATQAREGRFKQADGGTLFLDEIAEMPLELQSKLLRTLQEKTVDAIGADIAQIVDVRVVAATNRDLQKEIQEGRFREDLFYRLNVLSIHIPPLRERRDDILPLATHFLQNYADGRELVMSKSVVKKMTAYRWPGNIRELENACQRMAILTTGSEVTDDSLPYGFADVAETAAKDGAFSDWPPLPKSGLSLIDLEKSVIERVLEMKSGNVTQAATYLGIPRHILAYRMQKYGLPR